MRYVFAILGVVLVVGALATVKYKQISSLIAKGKEMEAAGPPPEAIGTHVAELQKWNGTLTAVGSVAPVQGVAVSNDAPGVVTKLHFESGALVKEGDVLVELDSSVERTQLTSAAARKELAIQTLERDRRLVQGGVLPPAQLDSEETAVRTATADIDGIQAQIDRKRVRAPFSGRLGIRSVNVGQYLNPGTTIAVLVGVEAVFVDFTLPQQNLVDLQVGMPVHVDIDGNAALTGDGKIAAIDPSIDATTRSVKVRAQVPNKEERLHSGMFANVSVQLPERPATVVIPQTALVHASYGDSVFVVGDPKGEGDVKIARQQFVKLGDARGDFVSVLDGVKEGEVVVTAGAFKLRNNSPVVVDNSVATHPELSPKPENH